MNARRTATLPLICLTLTLAACGDFGEGESAGDELAEDTGETGAEEAEPSGGETGGEASEGTDEEIPEAEPVPEAEFCGSETITLDNLTPNVMLVLDKSGSMNQFTWDDDGNSGTPEVTRWFSLHGVVAKIAAEYQDTMQLGVTLFPAADAEVVSGTFEGACKVNEEPEVAVSVDNSAVLTKIPAADNTSFTGATPATAGILTAAAHLEGLGEELPRAMIFVTDGAANCASPENFVTEYDAELAFAVADAWEGASIPTFVVGIDIGEDGGAVEINPREALHEVALAGGVPREGDVGFYDATSPAALGAALDEITNRVACQLEIGFAPEVLDGMIIDVEGQEFGKVQSCESEDGWVQIDPDGNPSKIELCNAACTAVAEAGGAEAKLSCGV
jgi:hypothetical protein